jgi:hypothetical protein
MYYLEFRTKNCIDTTLDINYFNKTIANVTYTKFLDLVIDDTWYNHIDQLIYRLNSACYAIRAVKAMLSITALRMLYFSYVHSVISYGIFFGGVTPLVALKYSECKKILRIMTNLKKWIHVKNCLKQKKCYHSILSVFSLLLYVVNNQHLFTKNLEVCNYLLIIFIYPL